MHQKLRNQQIIPLLAVTAMACSPAHAGESVAEPAAPGDWCTWLQNKPGMLYKNKENSFLQSFQIEGRFQYQAAYLDGSDVDGNDFNESYDEYRRFRLGVKSDFLEYFSAKVSFNLVSDERNTIVDGERGDLDWGYDSFDEALLGFDIKKAFGAGDLDSLKLNYGRHKFIMSQEARTSSTKLLTVERSAISNKIYGSYRPTGLSMEATKGDWSFGGAIFSSTEDGEDNEAFNGWQDGVIYNLNAAYKVNDKLTLGADFVYNDADVQQDEDSIMDYAWATSINAEYDAGAWGIIGDLIYGDNGGSRLGQSAERSGDFWGAVIMPYYWLVDEKLQLVGQYQYQGSDESEGVRINSRYGRAEGTSNINSGRGDSHHSFYGGLNYYLCGHNAKVQAGIEYQTMDTPKGDFDTMTYVIGFRTFF